MADNEQASNHDSPKPQLRLDTILEEEGCSWPASIPLPSDLDDCDDYEGSDGSSTSSSSSSFSFSIAEQDNTEQEVFVLSPLWEPQIVEPSTAPEHRDVALATCPPTTRGHVGTQARTPPQRVLTYEPLTIRRDNNGGGGPRTPYPFPGTEPYFLPPVDGRTVTFEDAPKMSCKRRLSCNEGNQSLGKRICQPEAVADHAGMLNKSQRPSREPRQTRICEHHGDSSGGEEHLNDGDIIKLQYHTISALLDVIKKRN